MKNNVLIVRNNGKEFQIIVTYEILKVYLIKRCQSWDNMFQKHIIKIPAFKQNNDFLKIKNVA